MNRKLNLSKRWLTTLVALFMGVGILMAQEVNLSGTVTSSEDGSPLPGVSVIQKGTTRGTVTNIDGKYTISAQKGAVIVFSFIGMQAHEYTAQNTTTYNVVLQPETTGLEEVVVTALGITKSERAIGFAQSTIQAEKLVQKGTPNRATMPW